MPNSPRDRRRPHIVLPSTVLLAVLALAVTFILAGYALPALAQQPTAPPTIVATPTPTPEPEHPIPAIQMLKDLIAAYGWWALGILLVLVALAILTEAGREMIKTLADRLNFVKYGLNWLDRRKAMSKGIDAQVYYMQRECDSIHLLGIAEERITLNLDTVHVTLRVVEQSVADMHYRRARGETNDEEMHAAERSSNRTPVLMLLSDADVLAKAFPKKAYQNDADARLAAVAAKIDQRIGREQAPPSPSVTTRLLLLGPAGSGKTTTLRYAALCLAEAYEKQWTSLLSDKDRGLYLYIRNVPLPIYVRLTFFADTLPSSSGEVSFSDRQTYCPFAPATFLTWLDGHASHYGSVPSGTLSGAITSKDVPVLLLLDGLDEAGDEQQRAGIAEMISDMADTYGDAYGNRYLVASRPSGYGGLVHLRNFTERHLDVLQPDEAKELITKWFTEAERRSREKGTSRDADRTPAQEHVEELWGAIERNARLLEMSENPLLTTSMALLQYNNVRLPDQRARLYEKLVELLLEIWRKQNLNGSLRVIETVAQLARERRNLEYLAFEMQQQPGQVREVSLTRIHEWLAPRMRGGEAHEKKQRIRDVFDSLTLHSGLVQERNALYSFSHLTFQEYLAACALDSLDEETGATNTSVEFLLQRSDDKRWRETLLLAAGRWSNDQRLPKTRRLLEGLLHHLDTQATVETTLLVAQALIDVAAGDEFSDLAARVQPYLAQVAFAPNACPNPRTRNEAAELLDRLDGDTRTALDFTHPDYWAARIEPGEFILGDDNGEDDDEKPALRYRILRPYALARFPVTNRQYLAFLDDLRQQGHTAEADERRPRSGWPGTQYRAGEGNHPVVWVTWDDVTAFAAWLDRHVKKCGIIPQSDMIRLPTEPEWERAAAYPVRLSADEIETAKRLYPWGNEQPNAQRMANTEESGLNGTSVVGIFPQGRADCGAEDLAGNVWEWCATPYLDYSKYPPAEELPVESEVGKSSGPHALHGGSYYSEQMFSRCSSRRDVDVAYARSGVRIARLFS